MARDSQRSKVYKWEKKLFASQWKEPSLTQEGAVNLFNACLLAGGRDPAQYSIKFTKRKGGACAGTREANFTPGRLPPIIVIHEAAHALTWFRHQEPAVMDNQGHGPRYLSCYLALIERFLNLDIGEALVSLTKGFEEIRRVRVHTGETEMVPSRLYMGGMLVRETMVPRPKTKVVEQRRTVRPPKYDTAALKLWRERLKDFPA